MGAAARALTVDEARDVTRAIAQHGEGLLRQRRQHALAALAGRDRLIGVGVDHLGVEVVVEDVQRAFALAALGGDAGPDDLREPVDVAGVDPPRRLQLLPHRLRPGLGAEDPVAERNALPDPVLGAFG